MGGGGPLVTEKGEKKGGTLTQGQRSLPFLLRTEGMEEKPPPSKSRRRAARGR